MTWSDGSIRGFRTELYGVEGEQVAAFRDINNLLQRDFDVHHKCEYFDKGKKYKEQDNIAGLRWVDGSSKLLAIVEVPPDSSCDRGYFGGYLVDTKVSSILDRLTPEDVVQRFGKAVGQRLKADYEDLTYKEKVTAP